MNKKCASKFLSLAGGLLLMASARSFAVIYVIDSDGNGSQNVSLSGSSSSDPDGAIIDYQWSVNSVVVSSGFGPTVGNLNYDFALGTSAVLLSIRDDAQAVDIATESVAVLDQSSNGPPVASAIVPSSVEVSSTGVAQILVDASGSSDPENDTIFHYKWTEGAVTLFEGASATATLNLSGVSPHTIRLEVFSIDGLSIIQSDTQDFPVTLLPLTETLAGRTFTREAPIDFAFDTSNGNFSGLTYNALTQTYFMTENNGFFVHEIQPTGALVRSIDVSNLKNPAEPEADVEGITWMYDQKYAIVMESGEEMAIVNIGPATTQLLRAGATIYDLSGDPKGVAYSGSQDALYWVSENNPKRVIKSRINPLTNQLEELQNINVDSLPVPSLSDIAIFPRLTSHLVLLSTRAVAEVNIAGATPVLVSSMTLLAYDIPAASGITFGPDGKMRIVNKREPGPEDDLSVFDPSPAISNLSPVANAGNPVIVLDSDGNGSEVAQVDGTGSADPDGTIIRYEWRVNGVLVFTGFGPPGATLSHTFSVGISTVSLTVFDDAQAQNQTTVQVNVKDQTSNLPPVASAVVPSSVEANGAGVALVAVNAAASSDPDGDPINRYLWLDGGTTVYDGTNAIQTLTINGLGAHLLTLRVYSTDGDGITQSSSTIFPLTVNPLAHTLAGRSFSRISTTDFAFDTSNGNFSGFTYNPLTQTYFMTENNGFFVHEVQADGSLVRSIDVSNLKNPAEPEADVEGITWMYGTQFGIVMESGEELAVVNILPATTQLLRAGATIYTLSGDPKGITYAASEDALYWVSEDTPKRIFKSKINTQTGQLDELREIIADNLPVSGLSDITYFPRLSSNLILISHSSRTIMEVDITGATPVLISSMTLFGYDIPAANGIAFGPDGRMYVVGKREPGPEDDLTVFEPSPSIPNQPPNAQIESILGAIDRDGNGSELVTVRGLHSLDPDGAIIRYEWHLNGVKVADGFGPTVKDLNHEFTIGMSTVTLVLVDDNQISSQTDSIVTVHPPTDNLPPVADAIVPPSAPADATVSAIVAVDASLSHDPEGDIITRYVWAEGANTFFDGASATTNLLVQGLGDHNLTLTVYSTDADGITQSGTKDFFFNFYLPQPNAWRADTSPA